jgi:hypothetical protein
LSPEFCGISKVDLAPFLLVRIRFPAFAHGIVTSVFTLKGRCDKNHHGHDQKNLKKETFK